MSHLSKVIEQIKQLDPREQKEVLFQLSEDFFGPSSRWWHGMSGSSYPGVVETPDVCGGAARMIRTRIPVWTLERMRQVGISEADILKSYPALTAIDLVQAWSYVDTHRAEIDELIRENEA